MNAARARRGFSVLLVLGLLSMAFGVSYAIIRSQMSSTQLQDNVTIRSSARQAALTGLASALRRMHESSWAGVNTTLTGSAGTAQSYSAAFTTGDSTLTVGSANYADWPFRVTVDVTGYAAPTTTSSNVVATHSIRAVVQFVPKAVGSDPTNFSTMLGYSICQHAADSATIEVPCHIEGNVRWQDQFRLCTEYPPSNAGLNRFLSDLNAMRSNGYADYRPLSGQVHLPYNRTSSSTRSLLTSQLGLTTVDLVASASTPTFPSSAFSYRLYPGGKTFSATLITSSSLHNYSSAPNAQTNPLGLLVCTQSGGLTLSSNINVVGTLVTTKDLYITGNNVTLSPAPMPALNGTTRPIWLPSVVTGDDLYIYNANATISGLVAVADDFTLSAGSQDVRASLAGRLLCKGFFVQKRSEWDMSSWLWSYIWSAFNNQLNDPNPVNYYPVYLAYWGLSPVSTLTVKPETTEVRYRWLDASNPVYAVANEDAGLRWTLVRWQDLD